MLGGDLSPEDPGGDLKAEAEDPGGDLSPETRSEGDLERRSDTESEEVRWVKVWGKDSSLRRVSRGEPPGLM